MDLITQGLLGACVGQALFHRKLGRKAALLGGLAGMLPDADVMLTTFADPAFPYQWHRHFSHSFFFAPLGGLIIGCLFLAIPAFRTHGRWRWTLLASFASCMTHAPLDWLTSFGTMLLWPFTDKRYALDLISVIDPFFSGALILCFVAGMVFGGTRKITQSQEPKTKENHTINFGLMNKTTVFTFYFALSFAAAYILLGIVQQQRIYNAQKQLADARGHSIQKARVKTTIGNLILWRSHYITDDGYIYTDSIRAPLWTTTQVNTGTSIKQTKVTDIDFSHCDDPDQARASALKLEAFADGFTAFAPDDPNLFADMRYCLHDFDTLWGQRIPNADSDENERQLIWVRRHADRWDVPREQCRVAFLGDERWIGIKDTIDIESNQTRLANE